MAVFSNDESIDAVGACIGYKGARVNSIVDSLQGEKIDIINYSKDIETFISNALSPADIIEVLVNEKNKQSLVVVEDDQLSLAIGKEGQNARLAARLTGWKIDIKSKLEFDQLDKERIDEILGLNQEEADVSDKSKDETANTLDSLLKELEATDPFKSQGYEEDLEDKTLTSELESCDLEIKEDLEDEEN